MIHQMRITNKNIRFIRRGDILKNIKTNTIEIVEQINRLFINGNKRRLMISTNETFDIDPNCFIILNKDKHGRKNINIKRTNGRIKK